MTLGCLFCHLILVFVSMQLPTFIILFFLGAHLPLWAHWVARTWSHLQGAVSTAVSVWKPDIAFAVCQMLPCIYSAYPNVGPKGSTHHILPDMML